ncbi:MAG: hypothetical protein M1836_002250 [Candelina mexicana]|nr:MAG: hypothetical protein M1836_002250 [Candelina mexicana]
MKVLQHLLDRHLLSVLTSFAFLTVRCWAAVTEPPGDTLPLTGKCDRDGEGPPLQECNIALENFKAEISHRKFTMDQTIEFLSPGTVPLHCDQYPRQVLSTSGQYHTFAGNYRRTCIIRFFMYGAPLSDPYQPASSLSNYAAFHSRARVLIDSCVAYNHGGWARIKAQGRDIGVVIQAGSSDEPIFQPLLEASKDYKPAQADIYTIPVPPNAGQGANNLGQGGFNAVNYLQTTTHCNTQLDPDSCQPGSSCQGTTRAVDEGQKILWGNVVDQLVELAGTCLAQKGGLKR